MRKTNYGFTFIEVMIVVVIIGILAGIAYPAYMAQVLKSGRSDAKVTLNDVAQRMQRCFTSHNTYKPANGTCAVVDEALSSAGIVSAEGFYVVKLVGGSAHTPTAYELKAVAQGRQLQDKDCQSFTINQAGARTSLNIGSVDSSSVCW